MKEMTMFTVLTVSVLVGLVALLAVQGKLRAVTPPSLARFLRETHGHVPYHLVSRDAQIALQEFSQDFAMALTQALVEPWAKQNGLYKVTRALKTTYPIPLSAAGYREFLGEVKYRSLAEKSISLTPKTWQDGWSELARVIEAPDFTGWDEQPKAFATAAQSLENELVAALLEANPTSELDDLAFFHAAHLNNALDATKGTFDNDVTGAGTNPTLANLKIAKANFRKIKAPNGKPLGLRMTHVLAPAAQEETWKDLLEQDMVIQALGDDPDNGFGSVGNRHKGTVKPIFSDELTDDLQWYPLALNKPGMRPWIVQSQGAPEELLSDKSSDLYKRTLKVAVAYVLEANAALGLPQCVQRWAGTAPA
jgi:phage major head subunit gpT-like protein